MPFCRHSLSLGLTFTVSVDRVDSSTGSRRPFRQLKEDVETEADFSSRFVLELLGRMCVAPNPNSRTIPVVSYENPLLP